MLWVVVKLIEQSLKWKVSRPPSQNKILFRGAEEAGVWRRANWSLEFCGEHLPHNAPVTVTGARHRYEYMQQQRNRIFKFLKWLLAIVTRYRYCCALQFRSPRSENYCLSSDLSQGECQLNWLVKTTSKENQDFLKGLEENILPWFLHFRSVLHWCGIGAEEARDCLRIAAVLQLNDPRLRWRACAVAQLAQIAFTLLLIQPIVFVADLWVLSKVTFNTILGRLPHICYFVQT